MSAAWMNTFRLAMRMLQRDWRAGELSVLIAALILAVASVGSVGFFTDRVKGALTRQANLLLGGDAVARRDAVADDEHDRRRGRADSRGKRDNHARDCCDASVIDHGKSHGPF